MINNICKATRRKWALVLVFLMVITLSQAGVALAEAARVIKDQVNVRSAPGTDAAIVGMLQRDALVQVFGTSADWSQIASSLTSGWVRSDLLGAAAEAPYIVITREDVNLRSGPGLLFSVLQKVNSGTRLLLTGTQGEWYQGITDSGQVVYVRSDMAELASSAPAAPSQTQDIASAAGRYCIMVNGRQVTFDVQPRMENDRILVPVRAIFESIGASVSYDDATKTVYVQSGAHSITMPIDSNCPIVDGAIHQIDVPARIVSGRTMVPLRFAGEALGGSVQWDGATETATITIPTATSASPNLPDPGTDQGQNPDENGPDAPVETPPASPPISTTPPVPQVDQSLTMSMVRDNTGMAINLNANIKVKPEVTEEDGRVVMTFKGINLTGLDFVAEPIGEAGFMKAAARNDGENVLVEITFPAGVKYTTYAIGDKGYSFFIPNFITGIERQSYGTVGERLIIGTLCPVEYQGSQDGDTVTLKINDTSMGFANESYAYGENLINDVKVSQTSGDHPATTLVLATRNVGRSSFAISGTEGTYLNIILIDNGKIWPKGTVTGAVVLDPGHGGYDGGAPGYISNEKDVNLAIALKVRDILASKGISCEMTRDSDYFVSLDDRSYMANTVNAQLFVSIHSNSSSNVFASGTETYFYGPLENPELFAQRLERQSLATAIQTNMISYLRTVDRGVKEENFSVLRKTAMPSALTEVAFMSNQNDEAQLNTPAFQQQAAQAIADGIINYINQQF